MRLKTIVYLFFGVIQVYWFAALVQGSGYVGALHRPWGLGYEASDTVASAELTRFNRLKHLADPSSPLRCIE